MVVQFCHPYDLAPHHYSYGILGGVLSVAITSLIFLYLLFVSLFLSYNPQQSPHILYLNIKQTNYGTAALSLCFGNITNFTLFFFFLIFQHDF